MLEDEFPFGFRPIFGGYVMLNFRSVNYLNHQRFVELNLQPSSTLQFFVTLFWDGEFTWPFQRLLVTSNDRG